jgi:phage N-6-adenine-methyltransferase
MEEQSMTGTRAGGLAGTQARVPEVSLAGPIVWSTPQPIFDALDREFHFTIDLCADEGNAKCKSWLPRATSLESNWHGLGAAWLNPPYGKEITDWVRKVTRTHRKIVALIPGRTNAPWWHEYVMQAREIRFVRRKVSFANGNGCKGVPPWGACIVIWEWDCPVAGPIAVSWDYRTSK